MGRCHGQEYAYFVRSTFMFLCFPYKKMCMVLAHSLFPYLSISVRCFTFKNASAFMFCEMRGIMQACFDILLCILSNPAMLMMGIQGICFPIIKSGQLSISDIIILLFVCQNFYFCLNVLYVYTFSDDGQLFNIFNAFKTRQYSIVQDLNVGSFIPDETRALLL